MHSVIVVMSFEDAPACRAFGMVDAADGRMKLVARAPGVDIHSRPLSA